jgi:putative oxidoreductase
MPFLPLQDNNPERNPSADFGWLALRFFTFAIYLYYQLAADLERTRALIWEKQSWDLVAGLAGLGLPYPAVLAPVAVGLIAVILLGILLGFLCRFNALLFSVAMGFVLVSALRVSHTLNPQCLLLFIAAGISLAIAGPGRFSLDHLLAGRRARRRGARETAKTR